MEGQLQKPRLMFEVVDEIVGRIRGAEKWDNLILELERALMMAKYQRNLSRYEEVEKIIKEQKRVA